VCPPRQLTRCLLPPSHYNPAHDEAAHQPRFDTGRTDRVDDPGVRLRCAGGDQGGDANTRTDGRAGRSGCRRSGRRQYAESGRRVRRAGRADNDGTTAGCTYAAHGLDRGIGAKFAGPVREQDVPPTRAITFLSRSKASQAGPVGSAYEPGTLPFDDSTFRGIASAVPRTTRLLTAAFQDRRRCVLCSFTHPSWKPSVQDNATSNA